jgi:exonuclease SbcC
VRLLALYAYNFKKLKLSSPLQFSEGITYIAGQNESGKSTLLDAILYALYGRMIRPSAIPSNEEIIAYGGNDASVQLTFVIGDRTFQVTRKVHRSKPNEASLHEIHGDGHKRTLATTVKTVTKEIENLLGGITFNEIIASNVVAQKDLERLVEQSKEDRRRVINAFLNLESFTAVSEKLREEQKSLEGTRTTVGLLPAEREKLETVKHELDEYRKKLKEVEEIENNIGKLEIDIKETRSKFATTDQLFVKLESYDKALKDRENLSAQLDAMKPLIEDLKRQIAQAESAGKDLENTRTKLKEFSDLKKVEGVMARCDERLRELTELEAATRSQRERQQTLASEIYDRSEKIKAQAKPSKAPLIALVICLLASALSLIIIGLYAGFIAIVGIILYLVLRSTQERGARAYLTERELLNRLTQESSSLEAVVQQSYGKFKSTEYELNQLCKNIERYSSIYVQNISSGIKSVVAAMASQLEADRKEESVLEERARGLSTQIATRPETETRLKETEEKASQLQRSFMEIRLPELGEISFSSELLNRTREEREKLLQEISAKEATLKSEQDRHNEGKRFLEEHKDVEQRATEQAAKVAELEKRLKVVKLALDGVEKTAEALRERVRPNVEAYMSHILPIITLGRYKAVQLDEEYRLRVWDPEAGEFKERDVFSGGTEDQFLLSMRLAFALALLPEVKGTHPEFMFLDEPLGSSDEARREGILNLLNMELSQSFKQIFLVSHIGGLDEQVKHVIRLENGEVIENL